MITKQTFVIISILLVLIVCNKKQSELEFEQSVIYEIFHALIDYLHFDSLNIIPPPPKPIFDKKNNIPASKVEKSNLLKQLLKDGNVQVIEKDVLENYNFSGSFNNANSLKDALSSLPKERYEELIAKEKKFILELFEDFFDEK